MDHCTNCGKKLEVKRGFCTGCGQPVQQVMKVTPSRVKRSGPFRIPIIGIALFVLIGLHVSGAFYIGGKYSDQKPSAVSNDSTLQKEEKVLNDKKGNTDQKQAKEGTKEKTEPNQEAKSEKKTSEADMKILDIDTAIKELNNLSIHANGRDISLGEWEITKNDGKLLIQADKIPPANLEHIFTLYDQQNLSPIKKWSVEVLQVAYELEKRMQVDWNISVGNDCVAQYPKTLPPAVISGYSGSCGYSIPVLEASNWGEMTLFVDEKMMSQYTADPVFDYIESTNSYLLPHSDVIKLSESELTSFNIDELRLARNEIFARHGYVFKSDELESYFAEKTWYFPDPYYDGSLNNVEEYNVKLIENLEELY
ncbi:YARHG domain-containing protein [Guptibacillus spartinae]|uniref:YARHG domain-containing protein n=1 Tax=Guptibacillus spartinae TaxID=3025679 RepID=UPI0023627E8D|nr:YARHG domain-containing protein [Pseudalkalibacillus spartinae]